MSLSKGLKILNAVQTAGFFILKLAAAFISLPYEITVAIPNYINNIFGIYSCSQEKYQKRIFDNIGGNSVFPSHNNTTFKVSNNPNPVNFPRRIFFAIISPILFAITAPFADLKDMAENIIKCIREEDGENKLKFIPLLIIGLIKCAVAPLRGFADGLTNSYMRTISNKGSATHNKIVAPQIITNPIAQVGLLIASPVVDVAIKTFSHLYTETKMFGESNADFLKKRDIINRKQKNRKTLNGIISWSAQKSKSL